MRRLGAVVVLFGVMAIAGCINVFWKTDVRAIPRPSDSAPASTVLSSPVKVHLLDGSTVIFRSGATVAAKQITGAGQGYALLSSVAVPRQDVPMDSVVGVEAFEGRVLTAPTLVVSAAATAVGGLAAAALLVALFGSCPTVYTQADSGPVLQAEGFSYAIAPLLEHRDLDPLQVQPDSDGIIRLELRNEALETHFINQIQLVQVRHAAGEQVLPDQEGRLVAVSQLRALSVARDRDGRDVRAALASQDGRLFSTSAVRINAARIGDLDDWIDVEATDLAPGDSIAVVLKLRNSLLNTVLLYEGMLGGRDAPDWLSNNLQHIASAVDLSRWYVRTMGMRATVDGVPVPSQSLSVSHARIGDVGPIAFREVAMVLPRPNANARDARVRLRFVADNWRVDQVRIAATLRRPSSTPLAVAKVVVPTPANGVGPALDTAAIPALADPDDRYLETRPGQRMTLEFAPASASHEATVTTSYLIAWQGWYREWIRGRWLANPTRVTPFEPGDAAVLTALTRWQQRKVSFEKEFYSTRLPVR